MTVESSRGNIVVFYGLLAGKATKGWGRSQRMHTTSENLSIDVFLPIVLHRALLPTPQSGAEILYFRPSSLSIGTREAQVAVPNNGLLPC